MTIIAEIPQAETGSKDLSPWLKRYYAARALVSAVWVALAFTVGASLPTAGTLLLVGYPLWDCVANFVDATRNGGLRANPTQLLNVVVSAAVTLAVALAAAHDIHGAIGVIGVWAAVSGVLQVLTGIRRGRSAGTQWPQILSGAQSCLAAVHFILKATDPSALVSVADVAPYAAFGAFYFAVSAAVLAFRR